MHIAGATSGGEPFFRQCTNPFADPVQMLHVAPESNTSPAPEDIDIDAGALEQARAVCAPDTGVYEQALAALAGPVSSFSGRMTGPQIVVHADPSQGSVQTR